MDWRTLLLLSLFVWAWEARAAAGDPMSSTMWDYYHQRLLDGQAFVFDERIRLDVPPFAEDARQVPIQIDASAYRGRVQRMMAWAELNPIPRIFDFAPGTLEPSLAIRIRVEQATPIRVAVLTDDGIWRIGSARVEAAGGGCTAPSVVRAEAGWEARLGQVLGKRFERAEGSRLRLQVSHPMDNGLIGGIPEFFIEHAELRAPGGQVLGRIELFPAVSENPTLSFDLPDGQRAELWLRDNNGNEFQAAF